jgi:hypothetical protein
MVQPTSLPLNQEPAETVFDYPEKNKPPVFCPAAVSSPFPAGFKL